MPSANLVCVLCLSSHYHIHVSVYIIMFQHHHCPTIPFCEDFVFMGNVDMCLTVLLLVETHWILKSHTQFKNSRKMAASFCSAKQLDYNIHCFLYDYQHTLLSQTYLFIWK